MFHRARHAAAHCVIAAPRVNTVRLLETAEDLRAAVERAKEFERTRAPRDASALRYEQYLRDCSGGGLSNPGLEEEQGLSAVVHISGRAVGG